MTYQDIKTEASQYNVTIREDNGYILFECEGILLAWMTKHDSRQWKGFSQYPKITGVKLGTKSVVASWCLDWCANGF